ncbi:hypothetical protein B7P43_G09191 [Cryptotermes secundus]|nr:hypothetical protein B7P43_G09191 [Cryptotermes secundus]
MRKALEYAEKKAREDKSLASRKHMVESVKSSVITDKSHNKSWFDSNSAESSATDNTTLTTQNSTEIKDSVTDLCSTTVSSNSSNSVPTEHEELLKINDGTQTGIETHNDALLIAAETVTVPADGLAVVLGNAAEGRPHEILPTPGGGVQFALLMSPSLQQPLMLDKRLLTPSKYRPIGHERGTQTDLEVMKGSRSRRGKDKADNQITRKDRKKSASLERPHRGCKLPLRCRSQSQPTQPRMRLEDRPKWGVNRPGTQYIKQSEKDPYYQRRLKQRLLRAAMMGGGDTGTESDTGSCRRNCHTRGSSDENSRSPSPQQSSYHFNNGTNKRNVYHPNRTRNLDRNTNKFNEEEDKLHVPSVKNEQLESKIVLFRNRSYNVDTPSKPVQVDISSPIIENIMNRDSTQQKTSNHIMPSNILHNFSVKGSRRLLNRQNEIPITVSSSTKEQWSRAKDILSQLSSLRQGLLIKQQEWELTRSHTPQSESSWNS